MILWLAENSWLYVGSFSGSLVAMLVARKLKLAERISGLVAGGLSGCFLGPYACEMWFRAYDPQESNVPASVCFFVGLVAVGVIPVAIEKTKAAFSEWKFSIERQND